MKNNWLVFENFEQLFFIYLLYVLCGTPDRIKLDIKELKIRYVGTVTSGNQT